VRVGENIYPPVAAEGRRTHEEGKSKGKKIFPYSGRKKGKGGKAEGGKDQNDNPFEH